MSLFWCEGACGRKAGENFLPEIILQFGFDCIEEKSNIRLDGL